MARPPQSEARNTRQRIREAAIRLFAANGFAGTSTRELCEAAGVTKPVLYHYFGSKEELFSQLVWEAIAELHRGLAKASETPGTARERFIEVLRNDFEFTRREPETLRLLYRVAFASEAVIDADQIVQSATEELKVLTRIALDGVESGELPGNPDEIALGVLAQSHIHTLRYMVTGEGEMTGEQARRCVEVALGGVLAAGNARAGHSATPKRAKPHVSQETAAKPSARKSQTVRLPTRAHQSI